ncbi:MAG: hypothetical protein RJA07_235 [Bacteroidota bacterium]|jgi:hypothetical protein
MKFIIAITFSLLSFISFNTVAQQSSVNNQTPAAEHYGNTLNLALGIGGYYGYTSIYGRSLPVLHADYEFNVAKNFTLAPFINFYTYSNNYYWGNPNNPYRNYGYREIVIPIGVKGAYYFDQLLKANSKWDFYLAASLGFAIVNQHWDNGYNGNVNYFNNRSPLFLDFHVGTEYHINRQVGLILDLSTGISTFGVAIHQ